MHTEPRPISTDTMLRLVASERRRAVLHYLAGNPDRWVPVAELADELGDAETVAVALHHDHLPRLEDAGLVEVDPGVGVRYRGHEQVESLLEFVADDLHVAST